MSLVGGKSVAKMSIPSPKSVLNAVAGKTQYSICNAASECPDQHQISESGHLVLFFFLNFYIWMLVSVPESEHQKLQSERES